MSGVTEQFFCPFAGHIEPSEAVRLDNLEAAARDMASIAGVGFSTLSGLDGGRRLRSGRTYGGSACEVPLDEPMVQAAGLFMDVGFLLSPTSLALASRFTRAPYDPSMIRPCRREYSCVEGGFDVRMPLPLLPIMTCPSWTLSLRVAFVGCTLLRWWRRTVTIVWCGFFVLLRVRMVRFPLLFLF